MATANATRVRAERVGPESDRNEELLDRLAWLMDSSFRIPGTGVRFGLDSLIGLIPVIGDGAGGVIQAALILMAVYHYKLPKTVVARMIVNALLDTGLGSIPLLGDIFDVAFKANRRNVDLIRKAAAARRR